MTAPRLRRAAPWIAALVAPPLAALTYSLVEQWSRPARAQGDPRALVEQAIATFGIRAQESTARVLDRPLAEAVSSVPDDLRSRLEGIAIYEGNGAQPVEWLGSPLDTDPAARSVGRPSGAAHRQGRVLRWITVSAPDLTGRCATATFILDDGRRELDIAHLLPRAAFEALDVRVEAPGGSLVGARFGGVVLRDATLRPVAVVRAEATPRPPSTGPLSPRALAIAALAFASAMAWGAMRRGPLVAPRSVASTAGGLAAVTAARAALLMSRAPAELLPADLGGASLIGAAGAWGLLSSPADVALTALTALLASHLVVEGFVPEGAAPHRLAVPVLGSAAATLGAWAIAVSWVVSANSRVRLPGLAGETLSPALALMMLGLGGLVLAASLPWGGLIGARRSDGTARRRVTWLAILSIAAVAGWAAERAYDRVAVGRLQAEFGPQVLERRATSELALEAALDDAAAALRASAWDPRSQIRNDAEAHDLWLRGPLFHSGLKSSLTLFNAVGEPVGQFGFDLPALDERIVPATLPDAPRAGVVVEPFLPIETVRQSLLHGGVAVRDPGGELRGAVVAHVLDEPDNLSFLPGSRTYLAALGGDPPDPWGARPDYVAYDPFGVAVYQTVPRPPAWTYSFDKAALEGRVVHVEAGGSPYHALPLVESRRLHLLLVPAATVLDHLGIVVRLAAIAAVVFALFEIAAARSRERSGPGSVVPWRRSYYRKLAAALVAASVVPWLGLSLVVQRDIERRGRDLQEDAAVGIVSVARRVVEDYQRSLPADAQDELPDDALLRWLRRLVGQDIHLYADDTLVATSKRELLDAGLLPPRLPSDVDFAINKSNRPAVVRDEWYGAVPLPVAYAPVSFGDGAQRLVVAVPLILAQSAIPEATARNVELVLVSTALLAAFLAIAAAPIARTVARPIRDLAAAAQRVAAGDYDARLHSTSRDEIGDLVRGFDAMVSALQTQRADLERRRDYMETLLRNATMGVVSTDAAGRVVTANPAAEVLLGASDAGLSPGVVLDEVLRGRPDLHPLGEAFAASGSTSGPVEVEIEREGPARRLRTVRVPLPDPEGGPAGMLVLLEDVTDLMRRNQLEAWAEMARAIAHEIKNPLTPIQLSTEHVERMLRDRGTIPDSEIETCLRTISKQVRALRDIAAEFSAYSKVPVLEPVDSDPSEVVRDAVAPYRHAPPPGVDVVERYADCPVTRIDRRVLSRAIVNLIENAIQAMPEGGVLVVATAPQDDGAAVRVTISDTGSGLSPDARSRLFEPYFSTKSSGTGLGLAIARQAVEAHRGTIEVESPDGGGTVFHIVLPASREGRRT